MKTQKPHKRQRKPVINEVAAWLATVCLLAVTALSVSVSARMPGGVRAYIVRSGSMAPFIPTGSIVVTVPQPRYGIGDVITFRGQELLTTHRIVEAAYQNGTWMYVTKGDANDAPDSLAVNPANVVGRVALFVPVLGYITMYAKTVPGYITLILIPAALLLAGEILSLKKDRDGKTGADGKRREAAHRYPDYIRTISFFALLMLTVSMYGTGSVAAFHSRARTSGNAVTVPIPPPELRLRTTGNGKFLVMQVKNITRFDTLAYELTYEADQGSKGAKGEVLLDNRDALTRQFTLGTCSGNDCSYHTGIHDLVVTVTLTDGDGGVTELTKTID